VLPVLYLLEGVAFAALTVLAGSFELWPVLALTLFDGVLAITARALARATTAAVLTPIGLLRAGNAITNAAFSICYMVGPALGGALVALGGTRAALLSNCGLFAAMALTLAVGSLATSVPPAPQERGRLRAAIAYARAHRPIWNLLAFQGASVLFFAMSVPVEVVLAQHTLHAGAGGYGALLSAWGAGAVVGSAAYARWRHVQTRVLLAFGGGAVAAGLAGLGLAPSIGYVIPAAAVGGLGNGIVVVAGRSALQELVEAQWLVRITGLSESIQQAAPGVGYLLGGAVTAIAGARAGLLVAAGGGLFVTAMIRLALPLDPRPAEQPAPAAMIDGLARSAR
jgi:macrolide resistance protein